jgi:glucosamine kinase
MILIADSGSTKTAWILCEDHAIKSTVYSAGLNPVYSNEPVIEKEIREKVVPALDPAKVTALYFYGAGCFYDKEKSMVATACRAVFAKADIKVETDLLGAARAVSGRKSGIVCILGTGSNSCFYDGKQIVKNIKPLGYILGDEGSGAYIGKQYIRAFLRDEDPEEIHQAFALKYKLSAEEMIHKVYHEPGPNRFLASCMKFLSAYTDSPFVRKLVEEAFRDFFGNHVMKYPSHYAYPVYFTGSVAFIFQELLHKVASDCDIKIEAIVKNPVEGLMKFHCS